MGILYEEKRAVTYFSIFDNSLVHFCDEHTPKSELLKQTSSDGQMKEKWGVRAGGIMGTIRSIYYKCDKIQHKGKEIKIPKVMLNISDNAETFIIELPFKTYGIDLIKRALTIVRTKQGQGIYALKVYAIKKEGKEFAATYATLYENGEKPGVISFYNETNPEPENIKWKKEENAQGETIWNRNASDKFFLDILNNEIAPYFEKLEESRKQSLAPISNQIQEAVIVSSDDDIF